jgi:hypothetical protein
MATIITEKKIGHLSEKKINKGWNHNTSPHKMNDHPCAMLVHPYKHNTELQLYKIHLSSFFHQCMCFHHLALDLLSSPRFYCRTTMVSIVICIRFSKLKSPRFRENNCAQHKQKYNFSYSHEFTFERSRESVSGTFNDASHHEKLAALAS